nr:uncharacterized mitochondrial protein AtMg00810-like [Tanacetum cinerariifolium]
MKSSTMNVESSNAEVHSHDEEVFHESFESFQEEFSSLNDDVQQGLEEVKVPSSNTQLVSNNMVPNVDEASTSHNVFNERLEDAYFDANVDWVSAMQDELDQFARLKVWRLVPRPEGKTVIKTKWIFKKKKDESSLVIRNKSRLVAVGYSQQERMTMIKRLHQFLESKLYACSWHEEVYVGQPPGFVSKQYPDHVYALDKALYGLKKHLMHDADHAGCHLDRKSTSDSVQFLGDKLVCWSSKKQNCVSISTAESEYITVSGCCAQVLWMRTQLTDYGFFYDKVPIYCDSKSEIAISCNPVQHTRTKHIDVRIGIDLTRSLPSHLGKLGLGDGV